MYLQPTGSTAQARRNQRRQLKQGSTGSTHLHRGGLGVLAPLDVLHESGGHVHFLKGLDALRRVLARHLQLGLKGGACGMWLDVAGR